MPTVTLALRLTVGKDDPAPRTVDVLRLGLRNRGISTTRINVFAGETTAHVYAVCKTPADHIALWRTICDNGIRLSLHEACRLDGIPAWILIEGEVDLSSDIERLARKLVVEGKLQGITRIHDTAVFATLEGITADEVRCLLEVTQGTSQA